MVKSHKSNVDTKITQKTKLFQYAGASRFAYNRALAREQKNERRKIHFRCRTQKRIYKA